MTVLLFKLLTTPTLFLISNDCQSAFRSGDRRMACGVTADV